MGKDGFQWFVGVVEDRNDPKTLGRVRVRCLGYHTKFLNKLPTADLPWAHVMNPITSATVSGVGHTPLGAVEGTWVIGFFIDGPDAIGVHMGLDQPINNHCQKIDHDLIGGDGPYPRHF